MPARVDHQRIRALAEDLIKASEAHSPECKCPRCSGARTPSDTLEIPQGVRETIWSGFFQNRLQPEVSVEAVALRAAEAARGLPDTSRVNRVEIDLFTFMAVLIGLASVALVVLGVLAVFLANSPVS